jgi:tRNA G18 (ribose-2'-O)-methylase SpoU
MNAATTLKEKGFTLVATCLDDDAIPVEDVNFKSMDKVCVILGNEQRGLSAALRAESDVKVKVRFHVATANPMPRCKLVSVFE